MNVLFICRANVGRSQAAMEFFRLRGVGTGDSAGTMVHEPGAKITERVKAKNMIEAMRSYGVDMSSNVQTQLTPELAIPYDKLVVMAEPETIPDWLRNDSRTELWVIPDPKDMDLPDTKAVAEQIRRKVADI